MHDYWCPHYETWMERTWIDVVDTNLDRAAKRLLNALKAVEDKLTPNTPSETGYTEAELMRLMERLATGR